MDYETVLSESKEQEKRRAEKMPSESDALKQMFNAFLRLKDLGFKDSMYCHKDGSKFESIEAGSTGIHKETVYYGVWPNGQFFIFDNGDLWPSRPILFREKRN